VGWARDTIEMEAGHLGGGDVARVAWAEAGDTEGRRPVMHLVLSSRSSWGFAP
jgi:hypothetical protein